MKELTFSEIGVLTAKTFAECLRVKPRVVRRRKKHGLRLGDVSHFRLKDKGCKRRMSKVTWTDWVHCSEPFDTPPIVHDRAWALKIARVVATRMNERRITHMGYMGLPTAGSCQARHFGVVPIRLIAMYDIRWDTMRYSLAVMGARVRP